MPEPSPAPCFDEHAVPAAGQLLDADRQHGDAVFVEFDFFGNADDHGNGSVRRMDRAVGPAASAPRLSLNDR